MVSRDGFLLSIIWIIFTLLFAITTVVMLDPSPSQDALRSLVGPKLIFFSIMIAVAALGYRLLKSEAKLQIGSLSHTFATIVTFGLLFGFLFSVSIDLAQAYSLKMNDSAYNLSAMFLLLLSILFLLHVVILLSHHSTCFPR